MEVNIKLNCIWNSKMQNPLNRLMAKGRQSGWNPFSRIRNYYCIQFNEMKGATLCFSLESLVLDENDLVNVPSEVFRIQSLAHLSLRGKTIQTLKVLIQCVNLIQAL